MIKSIIQFSQLEDRLDADYYKLEYLTLRKLLNSKHSKKICDYAECISGYAFQSQLFSDCEGIPVVKMTQVTNDWIVDLDNAEYLPQQEASKFENFLLKRNDVLVALTGATIGNSAIYDSEKISILNQRVEAIRCKNISPFYLLALLSTKYFKEYVNNLCGGGARENISPKEIARFPLLAMNREREISKYVNDALDKRKLAEQKYKEIQELLIGYLKINIQDLKFQKTFSLPFSQLEDRFDGEYYQTKSLGYSKLLQDSGNRSMSLGDIAKEIKYGTSDKVIYQEKGIPFLRVTDINKYKSIDPTEGKFISENEARRLKPYQVKENDLIVSRTGTLGSVIYVGDNLAGSVFGSYFIKITPKVENNILPQFISIFLNSAIGKLQTDKLGSGGIQTNLTIEMIKSLIFPVLEIRKQSEICNLYNESITLQKESKELLKKAKLEVEQIIEGGENDNS